MADPDSRTWRPRQKFYPCCLQTQYTSGSQIPGRLENLFKGRFLGSVPREQYSIGLAWDPRLCIQTISLSDFDVDNVQFLFSGGKCSISE